MIQCPDLRRSLPDGIVQHGAEGDELAVVAGGIHAVGEEDDEHVGFGIDPDGGAGEAGVAEGARGKIPAR